MLLLGTWLTVGVQMVQAEEREESAPLLIDLAMGISNFRGL